MNDKVNPLGNAADTVLMVENEVLVRTALAEYLRHCGYRVIEASSADEVITVLTKTTIKIDIVFSAVEISGAMDGFTLAQWIRKHKPGLHVLLAGDVAKAAKTASELCEEGPHLKKPYEPEQVIEWIRRLKGLAPK